VITYIITVIKLGHLLANIATTGSIYSSMLFSLLLNFSLSFDSFPRHQLHNSTGIFFLIFPAFKFIGSSPACEKTILRVAEFLPVFAENT